MNIADIGGLARDLDGVVERTADGRRSWRLRGRLIARELDPDRVVIRCDFDLRDALVRTFPNTFSVPLRYAKHMMVVADLVGGDPNAITEAIHAAYLLQRDDN